MAENYDLANYTPSVIPAGYAKQIRELVTGGIALGWKLAITSDNAMRLISPDGGKVIQLNLRKTSHPIEQYKRLIQKHANPLLAPVRDPEILEKRVAQAAHAMEVRENTAAVATLGASGIVEAVQTAKEIVAEAEDPKRVVYEGPMRSLRGRGGGRSFAYESDIATERAFADGTRELTCVRCDYQGSVPLSMSSHWRKHIKEDERARGGHEGPRAVPLESDSGYRPHQDRVDSLKDSLAELLKDGLDWSDINGAAEALAIRALTWDHERRMTHGEQATELTPEQVLDRIRNLVDGGKYSERMEEIRSLRDQIQATEQMVAEMRSERDRAREQVTTLKELISGLD